LAIFGGVPGGAAAQEDGVIVDPNSPTGKEYAIPLDKARRDSGTSQPKRSSDSGSGSTSTSSEPDRFGEGIAPVPQTAPRRKPVRRKVARHGAGPAAVAGIPPLTGSAPLVSASTDSGGTLTLLIVLGVLAAGGLGFALRRVAQRREP
jgi:hypothetical protein